MVVLKNKRASGSKGKKMVNRRDKGREEVSRYAGDAYDLARRTWTGLNQIRKLINIEEKYSDTNVSQTPDQNGTATCITQLAQGTTMNTRVGNSIRVQRVEVRGRLAVNSAVTTYSTLRLIVFRDMEGQGTAPVVSDLLETVGTSAAPRQAFDWLNRKRFAILHDSYVVLSPGTKVAQEFAFIAQLDKHTLYRGTTAASGSDGEGSIYVATVSDESTNFPSVGLTARITYTDD